MQFNGLSRVKVTANYACQYWNNPPPEDNTEFATAPLSNLSDGYLSDKAIVRLRERINYMVYMAQNKELRKSIKLPITKYKLVFITLTLPSAQLHSDRIIKQHCLKPLLRIMRGKWKCKNYLWKAEVQDNGNLHFHITTDAYIHWESLRDAWNSIIETLGYVSRGKSSNPNSTDIHAMYKVRNVAAYLSSYISKKDLYKDSTEYERWEEHYYKNLLEITGCDIKTKEVVAFKRPIEGKIYDCNSELKKIKAVWEDGGRLSQELIAMHDAKYKRIATPFFTLTFYNNLSKEKNRYLKFLLDHFIESAYKH